MQRPEPVPWAGIATLAAAVVGAGLLLGHPAPEALLNTWYLSRASGLVAYLFLWLSVCIGLLQSTRLVRGITAAGATIDVHEFTSLFGLSLVTFHGVILLWDHYVSFSWSSLLIPFSSRFHPFLVGLGTLSFYLALAAAVSSYVHGRLGPKGWRIMHLGSLVAFAFALVHGVLLGTDAANPAVGYLYRFTGISVALLVGYRIYRAVRQGRPQPTAAANKA